MNFVTWQVKGLKELQEALKDLEPEFRDQAVRQGLRHAGEVFVEGMQQTVPVATVHRTVRKGRNYPERLVNSLRARVKFNAEEAFVEVGPTRRAFWGRFHELGTRYHPAQHWMVRAFEADAQIAIAAFATGARDKLNGIVRRAARRSTD